MAWGAWSPNSQPHMSSRTFPQFPTDRGVGATLAVDGSRTRANRELAVRAIARAAPGESNAVPNTSGVGLQAEIWVSQYTLPGLCWGLQPTRAPGGAKASPWNDRLTPRAYGWHGGPGAQFSASHEQSYFPPDRGVGATLAVDGSRTRANRELAVRAIARAAPGESNAVPNTSGVGLQAEIWVSQYTLPGLYVGLQPTRAPGGAKA